MTGARSAAHVAVRAATPADLPAALRLLGDARLPADDVPALFAEHAGDFAVAAGADGTPVGVAGLEVCGPDALLRSVAVGAAWRGRGVGDALVRHLVGRARARGLGALYLLTTTAEGWFPRYGFAPVAREDVPAAVRATPEFRGACPASAAALALRLAPPAGTRPAPGGGLGPPRPALP